MKTISRTIATTTITALAVTVVNGGIQSEALPPIVFNGEKLSHEKAQKEVVKKYGKDKQIVIKSLDIAEDVYEIDFNVFMQHARKVN